MVMVFLKVIVIDIMRYETLMISMLHSEYQICVL